MFSFIFLFCRHVCSYCSLFNSEHDKFYSRSYEIAQNRPYQVTILCFGFFIPVCWAFMKSYFSKYALLNYQHWVKGIVGTVELMIFYFFYLVWFSEHWSKNSPILTVQYYSGLCRFCQTSWPYLNQGGGPGALYVEIGFTWTFSRNQDATVKLKSELISIKFW